LDLYALVKTLHIISATILFGTGIGIAFFFIAAQGKADQAARLYAARTTVLADMVFTLPAVIVQPLTGAWLVWQGGFDWLDFWLVATYALYALAGVCWLPVVWLQIRMKQLLEQQAAGIAFDTAQYRLLLRWWFWLGWPAFGGLVIVFGLMVTRPTW
jgi:uncharacterized membrane protein